MVKQIIQLDDELKAHIHVLVAEGEKVCKKLTVEYQADFETLNQRLVIEVIRIQNGKSARTLDVFENNYECFIEVGIEEGDEYYPNGYIPIWKVRTEWFQKVGYLMDHNFDEIEAIITSIVEEMLDEGVDQ